MTPLSKALAQMTAEALVTSAMDAIIIVDSQQRVVLFNPAAEAVFGVPAAKVLGQGLNRFIPARFRHAHVEHFEHFAKTGASQRKMHALGTLTGLRADGSEFPMEATISAVKVGGHHFFTVMLRDVTERKQSEAALEKARAQLKAHAENLEKTVVERTRELREHVSELEVLNYSLSHDLRAPLRAISGYIEVLRQDFAGPLGKQGREYLDSLAECATRLDKLFQGVLSYARALKGELRFQVVELQPLVQSLLTDRSYLRPPKATVHVQLPLLPVYAHPAAVSQCIVNLLENAAKFVAPGKVPEIRLWTEPAGERVRLWVQDNGIGIPREAHAKLFNLFARLHDHGRYPGTGIGLAIVRKAVERMGGRVGLESKTEDGSRFWIELPARPPQTAAPAGAPQNPADGRQTDSPKAPSGPR